MDMSIAMRFVMVQARRDASKSKSDLRSYHVFWNILELAKRKSADIARKPEHLEPLEQEIRGVASLIEQAKLNVPDMQITGYHTGKEDEGLIPDILAKAELDCEKNGDSEITAVAVLRIMLDEPTPTIASLLTYKKDSSSDETVFQPMPDAGETVLQGYDEPKAEKKPIQEQQIPAKQEPVRQPEPPKEAVRPDAMNAPVFFEIPKADAPAPQAAKAPPRQNPAPPKQKRRTKIFGLTFSGGAVWAGIQYYLWVLLLPLILLIVAENLWGVVAYPPNKFAEGMLYVFYLLWLTFLFGGVTSLIKRRFQAFGVFFEFVWNTLISIAIMAFIVILFGLDEPNVWLRIGFCVYIYMLLGAKLVNLNNLRGDSASQMKSFVMKLQGAPAVMFFTYVLRSLTLPLIVFSVMYIFNLAISVFWQNVFAIYGFLWAYYTVLVLFQSCMTRFNGPVIRQKDVWKRKALAFFRAEHVWLMLPEFGLFLMWYFEWFPMPVWTIVLYSIYGLFWLIATISALVAKN